MEVIGVDIGGTKIAAALVTAEGQIHNRHIAATPTANIPWGIIETVAHLCEDLQRSARRILGIGIGTAGQIDPTRGVITYAVDTLPGWVGTPLVEEIQRRTGLPVIADNDVNAMALGEVHFGAGRGYEHGLYVTVGTGIGGAVILNEHLWRGAQWSAGEIGHLLVDWQSDRRCTCGEMGHLEAYAAGPAMARRYCEISSQVEHIDLRQVAQLAGQGNHAAQQAITEGAHILGLVLSGLMSAFDPQILVIGGGVPDLGELWWNPFENALRACPMPAPQQVILKHAELGNDATLVGAAWLAFDTFRR